MAQCALAASRTLSSSIAFSGSQSRASVSHQTATPLAFHSPCIFENFVGLHKHLPSFSRRQEARAYAKRNSAGVASRQRQRGGAIAAAASAENGAKYDYDLIIIGAGVGGHGAALHAVEKGLRTAIVEGDVVGGTCVNRGCVPSKALLAVSGRMREMKDAHHLKALGIQVDNASYDRAGVAEHANGLATKIRNNLINSLTGLGVEILEGNATILAPGKVQYGKENQRFQTKTAKNIIIATGSIPFVPPGIEVDGKTVFTSDHALKLEWIPDWIAIVGSGYIGLEFSDVYTALGSDVTFIEALDGLMPGFDPEIGKMAQRLLIQPRNIDYHTGVLAKKITPARDGKPVTIELVDTKTRELKETLEVDAALIATGRAPYTKGLGLEKVGVELQRGYVPVDERMRVLDKNQEVIPGLYCIGDANGKMMLAHAASAQGISAVENMVGNDNILNHLSVPAACFTHPEISFAGLTEPQVQKKAEEEGFEYSVAKTSFKANSKALAENEGDGIAKVLYRKDTGEILGVHIIGLHAADLIHEASNAIATGLTVKDLKFAVHAHPTLSEVLDELFKSAHVDQVAPPLEQQEEAPVETLPADHSLGDTPLVEAALVDIPPVDTAPVETAPVDTLPVTAPVNTAPVDTAPVDTAPVDTALVDTAPVDTARVASSSVEFPPVGISSVDSSSVDSSMVEKVSVDTSPVDLSSVETSPLDTAPVDTFPVDTPPVETSPVALLDATELEFEEELLASVDADKSAEPVRNVESSNGVNGHDLLTPTAANNSETDSEEEGLEVEDKLAVENEPEVLDEEVDSTAETRAEQCLEQMQEALEVGNEESEEQEPATLHSRVNDAFITQLGSFLTG